MRPIVRVVAIGSARCMGTLNCDVLIIGGGPCGSTAAAFARQAGMSVIVAERDRFPRFHVGESLLPMGNGLLRASGVWSKVEQAGFYPKYGARFVVADGSVHKRIDFSAGYVPGLDQAFQVERAKFDQVLLDHAGSLGADIRQGRKLIQLSETAEHLSAELEIAGGQTETVNARWCVDCGGRENHYPNALKRELDPSSLPRRIAVYSHFKHLARAPGKEAGDSIAVRLDDGWFWLIPLDQDTTSVGLVTSLEALKSAGREPGAVFHRAVQESPYLREIFAEAIAVRAFQTTADYSYFRKRLAQGRVILAGDAGGFFDPIFSSGVYLALWSARLAIDLVKRADAHNRVLTPAECATYSRRIKKHAGVFSGLVRMFYDNPGFSVFMTQRPPLDLERGINSIVAGHARLIWPLRWRLLIFMFICRINRWVRLVPHIEIATRVRDTARAPA